jgi:glycosyltransferase involved in cell wall biosynthesis
LRLETKKRTSACAWLGFERSLTIPIPVSIFVLTHNEEADFPGCLASIAAFDDVHIVDSGSVDRTCEIARQHGVQVHFNAFRSFGEQRNWAIENILAKYEWNFHLDADERMTPALADELQAAVKCPLPFCSYRVPSKLLFAGRWLRRSGQYPAYQVRFFRKGRFRFKDYGHGQREATIDPIGTLKEPILHHAFSKGLDDWFRKHVNYARREAEQAIAGGRVGRLFSRDPVERRRWLKRMAYNLPGRFIFRLAYMLIIQRAILDGWPGITYSHMIATYEGMIEVYLRLLRRGINPESLGQPIGR